MSIDQPPKIACWRLIILAAIPIASAAYQLSLPADPGDPCYHHFADLRQLFGIPNFADVVSNLPFLLVGISGVCAWRAKRPREAPLSWLAFFVGVAGVGLGSAYYHWAPDDATLVWDRIPMTLGFMALTVAILAECIDPRLERILLLPALGVGVASVVYWHHAHDLRFYYWVQSLPNLFIPAAIILLPKRYSHYWLVFVAIAFYLGAKLTEHYDKAMFAALGDTVSGHSIKHLSAAAGCYVLLVMFRKRRAIG
jgi:hypothetical protein